VIVSCLVTMQAVGLSTIRRRSVSRRGKD